jgi:hypothetical protein
VSVSENTWYKSNNRSLRANERPDPTWQIGHVFVEQLPTGDWQVYEKEKQYLDCHLNGRKEALICATFALELLLARKRIAELEEAVYYACDGDAYNKSKASFEGAAHEQKRKRDDDS